MCMPLVDAGSEMGVALPATRGQMESHCKGLAAGGSAGDKDDDATEDTVYYELPPANRSTESTTEGTISAPDAEIDAGSSSNAECRGAIGAVSGLIALALCAGPIAA